MKALLQSTDKLLFETLIIGIPDHLNQLEDHLDLRKRPILLKDRSFCLMIHMHNAYVIY